MKFNTSTNPLQAFDEEPYPTYTLEEVLAQAAGGFHAIMANGVNIMGTDIPPLDPLKLATYSEHIKDRHANSIKFTLNDPVITGLNSIRLEDISEIDYKNNMKFSISLKFLSDVVLSCDDYDREGTFKILFKEYDITKMDRHLNINFSDVRLNLAFQLFVDENGLKVEVLEKEDNFSVAKVSTTSSSIWSSPFKILLTTANSNFLFTNQSLIRLIATSKILLFLTLLLLCLRI